MRAVSLVTSHRITSAGIASMFDGHPDIRVTVDTLAGVLAAVPDVVVYDLVDLYDRPERELDALVATPGLFVIGLTSNLRPRLADRALERGVDACVPVGASREKILATVEDACGQGGTGRQRHLRQVPSDADEVTTSLTAREVEVLQRITAGWSNQEICEDLFLSINSVKTHIRRAYRRIGVTQRAQAVVWAIQNGIVLDSGPAAAGAL